MQLPGVYFLLWSSSPLALTAPSECKWPRRLRRGDRRRGAHERGVKVAAHPGITWLQTERSQASRGAFINTLSSFSFYEASEIF